MLMRVVVSLVLVAGALGAFLYSDHQDEVKEARGYWEQAATLDRPSAKAKMLLCCIERRQGIILAESIASPDSFQAVQNRLNALWADYCRLEDQLASSPPDLGGVTLGNM